MGQFIDQRRFSDVRNAEDHGPHGAVLKAPGLPAFELRRCQGADEGHQLFDPFAAFTIEGHDLSPLLFIVGNPFVEDGRIGQVGLVEDDDRRLIADEGFDHGVGAAQGNAGVDEFDDDVDDLEIFLNQALGLGHMAGIPVDYHRNSFIEKERGLS